MPQRTWSIEREQSVGNFSTDRGNGHDDHAPVGRHSSGVIYRELLKPDTDWTNVYQIEQCRLRLKSTTQVHIAFGSSIRIRVLRLLDSFTSGGGSEGSWSSGGSYTVYGGPSGTTTHDGDQTFNDSEQDTKYIDITALVEDCAPASVLRRDGSPGGGASFHGVRVMGYDESTTGDAWEFYSIRSSSSNRPAMILDYDDNRPPAKPVIQTIEGAVEDSSNPVVVGSPTGNSLTVKSSYFDADGDIAKTVEMQLLDDGATDAAVGVVRATSSAAVPATAGAVLTSTITSSLLLRVTRMVRTRAQDSRGRWSSWSSLADENARIRVGIKVNAPASSLFQPTPDEPHIFGTLSSSDPTDYITGWDIEAYRDDATGSVNAWPDFNTVQIGGTSTTRSDVAWGGIELRVDDKIRWRHRHYNRDGIAGEWSTYTTVTIVAQTGPTTITPADTSTKLLSRTGVGQMSIGNAVNFDGYQWRVYRSGALVYDSGLVPIASSASVAISMPAGTANWGDTLEWEAAVRAVGAPALGLYSNRHGLQINSLPTTTIDVSP